MGELYPIDEAREQRAAKAAALDLLREGALSAADVLRRPPAALSGTPFYDVLLACKGMGPTGVRQVCEAANVWPMIPMGNLRKFQRLALLAALPPRAR